MWEPGVVVVVILWWVDLKLLMQSIPITTDVVSSNPDQGEAYNRMFDFTTKPASNSF
jgi:hypothetical protein